MPMIPAILTTSDRPPRPPLTSNGAGTGSVGFLWPRGNEATVEFAHSNRAAPELPDGLLVSALDRRVELPTSSAS
jgi:hypothetical protein